MEFTKGKYRTRSGHIVEVFYRFHGNWLRGRVVDVPYKEWNTFDWSDSKGIRNYSATWEVRRYDSKQQGYEGDIATYCGKYLGKGEYVKNTEFDLMEKVV